MSSNLLLNEPPLVLQKSLAVILGLNEALVIQQLHYWSQIQDPDNDGEIWVEKSQEELKEAFPFWSVKTISRTMTVLQNRDLVIKNQKKNWNRTYRYQINYGQLEVDSVRMQADNLSAWKETDCPDASGQSVRIRSGQSVRLFSKNKNTTTTTGGPSSPSGQYQCPDEEFDYLNWEPDAKAVEFLEKGKGIVVDDDVLTKFKMFAYENSLDPRTLTTQLTKWLQREKLHQFKTPKTKTGGLVEKTSVTDHNQKVLDELLASIEEGAPHGGKL